MRYTQNAFIKAEDELSERRSKATYEKHQRITEIQNKAPEIYKLYRSLPSINYSLVKLIGSGKPKSEVDKIIKENKENNLRTQETIANMLEAMGYSKDYLSYHYYCSKCCDTGFIEGRRCECHEKLLRQYTMEELNANCSIQLHDFDEFDLGFYPETGNSVSPREKMRFNYNFCRDYANNFSSNSPSLFLIGNTGLGKTMLSSCIAKQLLENGEDVFFGSLLKLLRELEDEHFGRKQGNTMDIICNTSLVILDDLGSEFKTNFTESALYEIINERLNKGRPTIISTNIPFPELNEKYNDRIISRLTGCFTMLLFLGSDVRQEKRKRGL